jgi:hypothetical protein
MKTIMLYADHGLTLANFLLTDLARFITDHDARMVLLVQDALIPRLRQDFAANPQLIFESSRAPQALEYQNAYRPDKQDTVEVERKSSLDSKVPLTYVDHHLHRKEFEASGSQSLLLLATRYEINRLRGNPKTRAHFIDQQHDWFTSSIYGNLLDRYKPDLVLAPTAGWGLDRFLLREAYQRQIPTGMVADSWDGSSTNGLPGAHVKYACVWSDVQKWELTAGMDWPAGDVYVGGFALYDGYLQKKWVIPREEYYRSHGLSPYRKLISFVSTDPTISPNLHVAHAMADMVASDRLSQPCQLLIRLHPDHLKKSPVYQQECDALNQLARRYSDVHIAAPNSLAGGLPPYAGEDLPEKASMLTYSNLVVSIYSNALLETALHDRPYVSACIDSPSGFPNSYRIPLATVPTWPTVSRAGKLGAARSVLTFDELAQTIDAYLANPKADSANRGSLVERELACLNGESARQTGAYILNWLKEQDFRRGR